MTTDPHTTIDLIAAIADALNAGDIRALEELHQLSESWLQTDQEAAAIAALIDAAGAAVHEIAAAA